MRIEAHDDFRIAVELSDEDMDELQITYEDLDYSNIETRRVLDNNTVKKANSR